MGLGVADKLIRSHLVDGVMRPSEPIALAVDETLTQDATGTLVMLTLEAMELDRARTKTSVQYVDHNLIEGDYKNPDDHLFLKSAARRFGLWYSRPGNGVSHPLHMTYFARPGDVLLGSDSHTPASGALGVLAIGAGGLDVAMAIAGEPYRLRMPKIWGIRLSGRLPDWVSAKDVILELLRRHGVSGGRDRILEFCGPGLAQLSVMDRHVIANMGTELGATSTVFPADDEVRRFMAARGRADAYRSITADDSARYDIEETIELSRLQPLIATPSSPGNVVPVEDVAGREVYQAYIGSSANPGYRDLAIAARIVDGKHVPADVSFDINPTSRDQLVEISRDGLLTALIKAGARLHQVGCNGCIGMGQAPATGRNSLRTVPRNFPGRSGTPEDSIYLCSPETAVASALVGKITDPRTLAMTYPAIQEPDPPLMNWAMFEAPLAPAEARNTALVKGPNIKAIPALDQLPDEVELPILLKVGDNISTDEIMPAGSRVLPYRSNIPKIAHYVFQPVDADYVERALALRSTPGHAVVGGANYGQGSSREHAALAPRYLGLRAVIAKSYARIHRKNLINYGIVPFEFVANGDFERLGQGSKLLMSGWRNAVVGEEIMRVKVQPRQGAADEVQLRLPLDRRERKTLLAGGEINLWRTTASLGVKGAEH